MSILETFVAFFAPHICLGCGVEGYVLCKECVQSTPAHPEICWRCHSLSTEFKTCPECRRYAPLGRVFIAGLYEGPTRQAIYALKFGRSLRAAAPLAQLLINYVPRSGYDLIVPVPAATSRLRRRGYNPAAVIAHEMAGRCGMRSVETLGRLGQKRQVGARRKERLEQPAGTYYVTSSRVRGARVLLIDDVITTGATLAEAARALKAAGARSIDGAVIARHVGTRL